MTAFVIWIIFTLMWVFPGSVGRWLADVNDAYLKELDEQAAEKGIDHNEPC